MTKLTHHTIKPKRTAKKRKGLRAPIDCAGSVSNIREAVLVRAQQGIEKLVDDSSEPWMLEALTRPTGVDVLIHLLSDATAMGRAAARTDDPLRNARARAVGTLLSLLTAEGGTFGVVEVAERLRLGRAAVDARRKAGKLLAVEGGSRTVAYPVWQFTDHSVLDGLEQALAAFHITDPTMKISFFLSENPDVGGRPLDALRQGRVDDVREAAARFGRFGDDG